MKGDVQVYFIPENQMAFLKSHQQSDLPFDPQQTSFCTNHIQNVIPPSGQALQPASGRRPLKAALRNFSRGVAFLYSLSDSVKPEETPRTTKKGKPKK